jgi:hypothetical protein
MTKKVVQHYESDFKDFTTEVTNLFIHYDSLTIKH